MSENSSKSLRDIIEPIIAQAKSGDLSGAIAECESARQENPGRADLYHLGSTLAARNNDLDQALELLELSTRQKDTQENYLLDLAQAYIARKRREDAKEACRTYIARKPDSPHGYDFLSQLSEQEGDLEEAERHLQDAIPPVEDDDKSVSARLNLLGRFYRRNLQLAKAVEVYEKALELEPDRPELHFNIANALMDIGEVDPAIKHYRLTLDENPHHPDTHLHLGFAYLLKGNFKRGWREMEWRWKIPVFEKTALSTPRWKGEQVDGTVLLLAEQGFGDSVHFVRYAKQVAERCAKVVAYVPPALVRLVSTCPGVDEVYGWDTPIPEHVAYVPMMSLPYVFKTDMHDIPADVPYLSADTDDAAKWAERIKDLPGPKIGFVWQGNPNNERERLRAIPTAAALRLVNALDASFVCMTKDRPQGIEQWPDNLHHFGDEFTDVAEAAALVENLDMVLSIDTLMTHLAGALNKELWTLLAPAADWRYLLEREDSPWYPSARMVRRTKDEDWDVFMDRVAAELKAHLNV